MQVCNYVDIILHWALHIFNIAHTSMIFHLELGIITNSEWNHWYDRTFNAISLCYSWTIQCDVITSQENYKNLDITYCRIAKPNLKDFDVTCIRVPTKVTLNHFDVKRTRVAKVFEVFWCEIYQGCKSILMWTEPGFQQKWLWTILM